MIVLLDTGPAGLVANPNFTADSQECSQWLERIVNSHHLAALPEIVDYELRRELLRGRMTKALRKLDNLQRQLVFLPINSPVMRQAAEFWAIARQRGSPTADDRALDGDVILAAQARFIEETWQQGGGHRDHEREASVAICFGAELAGYSLAAQLGSRPRDVL